MKSILFLGLLIVTVLLASCFNLPTYGKTPIFYHCGDEGYSVYVFLNETCPICKASTAELRRVYQAYSDKGIEFVGIFPNLGSSTDSTIHEFKTRYKLPFECLRDSGYLLTDQFDVYITPTVIVVRNSDRNICYSGMIDNNFESVRKRRKVVTEQYLQSALGQLIGEQVVKPAKTEPVGCLILHDPNRKEN